MAMEAACRIDRGVTQAEDCRCILGYVAARLLKTLASTEGFFSQADSLIRHVETQSSFSARLARGSIHYEEDTPKGYG
jgi:hypothetical protein